MVFLYYHHLLIKFLLLSKKLIMYSYSLYHLNSEKLGGEILAYREEIVGPNV